MYLTRLELQGFKSFADKTTIEFGKNITSIVGPNGSGKSNISDAIRWVLGEQSIKNLRGSKFEDIIFSGTSARKSMGFAEVSLVLDNTQKLIDLDFTEITVTRRLFRNGNSEYLINMVPCRLKDIHEMFYDTGVGRTGYSIVGQGKIDEILSSRSEDRREVFEEASGITKYKLRKQESERKLNNTEQNLIRIKDIINELELQLEPLSLQAEKARKYLALREDLKSSEINLFVHNIKRLNDRNLKLDETFTQKEELIQARKKELNQLIEKEKIGFSTTKEIEQKIKIANDEFHELKSETDKIRSEVALLEEKTNNANENISRFYEEIRKLDEDKINIYSDSKKKKEKTVYLQNQLEQFKKKLDGFEEEYRELSKDLSDEELDIDKIKNLIMDKMDYLSDKKTQYNSNISYIDSIEKRKSEIKGDILTTLSEKDLLLTNKNEQTSNLNSIDIKIKKTVSLKTKSEDELKQKRKKLELSENESSKLLNEINFLTSRHRALKEMEDNLEGYSKSVKSIHSRMEKDSEFAKGIHGPLAKLLDVSKEYTLPIEISLGSVLQNIVTDDENSAKKAVEFLKREEIGRATFLPVSVIKSRELSENLIAKFKKQKGFLTIASEVINCKDIYRKIVNSFLSSTLIVEDIDSAITISRQFKNEYRIVTLEGEILNKGGAITGGSTKGIRSNLLKRNTEIEELSIKIEGLDSKYKTIKNENEILRSEVFSFDEEIKKLNDDLNSQRIDYIKGQGELKQTIESIERVTQKTDMLNSESSQLEKELTKNEDEKVKISKEIEEMEKQIKESKMTVDDKSKKQKERQTDRDRLNQDITDYKISVNSVLESIENLNENIGDLEKERAEIEIQIQNIENSINKAKKVIQNSQEMKEKYELEINNTGQRTIGKETLIERLMQEKENLQESISDAYSKKENIEKEIEDIKDEKNRIEIRKVKCDAEIDTIKNRLWDEYELTYGNCEKTAEQIDNAQRVQGEIENIRNSIKELGDVNVNSIDDYIKTKERYAFLKEQHQDMVKAVEDLERVIKEMETIMKKQFLEQFKKINEIFNQVFKDLFLGGTASISLVDESNVLESAIDINVQPPGKKLQNMMLLSGGERAFTAIALLFSIIKLKDTPFCILDEIDAALDDPNVIRFADYVQELTKRTQFILVTHRKGTMEASDVLYGVTAQEKGVSKIVSLNMKS